MVKNGKQQSKTVNMVNIEEKNQNWLTTVKKTHSNAVKNDQKRSKMINNGQKQLKTVQAVKNGQ